MAKLFLSYSFDDQKLATAVAKGLEEHGIQCWLAPGAIRPGTRWPAQLMKAIKAAQGILLLLTAKANESPHVQRELDLAVKYGKSIIPCILGRFPLDAEIEYAISGHQHMRLPGRGVLKNAAKIVLSVRESLKLRGTRPVPLRLELPKNQKQLPPSILAPANFLGFSVSYMRLYGALEVPLLMELIGADGEFTVCGETYGRDPYSFKAKDVSNIITRPLCRFWKKEWRFKKARPLLNPLWQDITGSKQQGELLYWRSLTGNRLDIVGYSSHPVIDECGDKWEDTLKFQGLKLSREEFKKSKFTLSSDVGFLFAIFECESSGVQIIGLDLEWFQNPLCRASRFKSPTPSVKRAKPLVARDCALKPQDVASAEPHKRITLRMANAKKGEAFILLLGVYRAKTNGMPDYFVTDYYKPKTWRWMKDGRFPQQQPIRRPHGLSAAKIKVPNGWFGQ